MLEPTIDEVTRAIEDVVAEAGSDFIYTKHEDCSGSFKCWYVWDGKPSCLVGKVLYRLGVDIDELSRIEHMGIHSAAEELRRNEVIDLPYATDTALLSAQGVQDGGRCWGDALRLYHVHLNH